MPRPRLPWFKLWVGSTRHGKIVTLSDRSFRVWVELMDAASDQKTRGRFDSFAAAAAIVRRKPAEVRQVAAAGLMDESEDGVWMHDWKEWQRWRPEDAHANDSDTPPEAPASGSGITHESLRNGTNKTGIKHAKKQPLARAGEDVDVEGDVEEERDEDVNPPAPTERPPVEKDGGYVSKKPPSKSTAVIDAFRELNLVPVLTARDHASIKRSNANPALIAEVYAAVARHKYGDEFMRRRLSVHEAIEWVNGYLASQAERAQPAPSGPIVMPRPPSCPCGNSNGYDPQSAETCARCQREGRLTVADVEQWRAELRARMGRARPQPQEGAA